MLAPIAYKMAKVVSFVICYVLIIAVSYAMVGGGILFQQIRATFTFRPVESDSESETGSESVSEEGPERPESPRSDLSGNEVLLLKRENEALQEANAAWFERVEEMEKQKRHANQQCSMMAGVGLMLFTVYTSIIYAHLLRKKSC
jgi:hypothetical protein